MIQILVTSSTEMKNSPTIQLSKTGDVSAVKANDGPNFIRIDSLAHELSKD